MFAIAVKLSGTNQTIAGDHYCHVDIKRYFNLYVKQICQIWYICFPVLTRFSLFNNRPLNMN